jgi:hypothetical protein
LANQTYDWRSLTVAGALALSSAQAPAVLDTPQLTIEAGGVISGAGTIDGPIANSGVILAGVDTPGPAAPVTGAFRTNWTFRAPSPGTGRSTSRQNNSSVICINIPITRTATLELGGPTSQNVSFSDGTGTLQLDDPAAFSGTITPGGPGDQMILAGASYASVTGYSYVGSDVGGTLTIDAGGTAYTFNFAGDLDTLSFALSAGPQLFTTSPPSLLIEINATASFTGGGQTINLANLPANTASLYDTAGDWDVVNGSGGTVDLTSAQSVVYGGADTINFLGGSGNAVSLADTTNNDAVNGTSGAVYLTSAQSAVEGGGDTINFLGGSGNLAGLSDTAGDWDVVNGSNGAVNLTSAQSVVYGGGDTIDSFGGAGNAASLADTAGDWDVFANSFGTVGTVYLTSAQSAVEGGGDAINFLRGSGNAASLSATAGDWDVVNGSNGAVDLTSAQSVVYGGGDTIDFLGASGNAVSLANTAGDSDWVSGSNGTIYLTNSQANLIGSGNTIDFAGGSGNVADLIDPQGFSGQFVGFASPDTVELAGSWSLLSLSENAGGSLGTLMLTNGINNVALEFAGSFTQNSFAIKTGTITVIGHS